MLHKQEGNVGIHSHPAAKQEQRSHALFEVSWKVLVCPVRPRGLCDGHQHQPLIHGGLARSMITIITNILTFLAITAVEDVDESIRMVEKLIPRLAADTQNKQQNKST